MPMRRVLFFIDSLNCGGAEKSLISLLPLLDYSQLEVDLMTVNRGGVFEQYVPQEVQMIDFPHVEGLWFAICETFFRFLLRLYPRCHAAELRWISMSSAYPALEKKYDVAIAYQQGFPTYYIADKVDARRKIAWVNADLPKVKYRISFNRPIYQKYDCVVPVSDVLCKILAQNGFVPEHKLNTVYDILNVDLIRNMSKQCIALPPKTRLRLVTVGRLVALKGYDLAVEAAAILKQKGLPFDWYFVGEGGMRSAIEQQIQDLGLTENIHLIGMVPNPYPYMVSADIYVQTSRYEGFGLTLCEARILHRPVISTNFPVVFNQITDGENGMICEMTAPSIADQIIKLSDDHTMRDRLVEGTYREENTTSKTEPAKVMKMILS